MYRTDFLFSSHLNYQINAAKTDSDDTNIPDKDIMSINLKKCDFKEFSKALLFEKNKNPDFNFVDSSLEAVKQIGRAHV